MTRKEDVKKKYYQTPCFKVLHRPNIGTVES